MAQKPQSTPIGAGATPASSSFWLKVALAAVCFFLIGATYNAFKLVVRDNVNSHPSVKRDNMLSTHAKDNVFRIVVEGEGGGTGFLVTHPIYGTIVLTNRHICDIDPTPGAIYVLDQDEKVYRSTVRRRADLTDLCIIEPPLEFLAKYGGLSLADRNWVPAQSEFLFVYGHPHLRKLTPVSGTFVNYSWVYADFIPNLTTKTLKVGRSDISIYPGNSGSPVLNYDGQVVGVVFAWEGQRMIALFIPLSSIYEFLEGGM